MSADSDDHTPTRHEEDAAAYVDSIGEPVHVAGWSAGVMTALGAAAGSEAVTAVAIYEPTVIPVMREDDLADLDATFQQVGAAAAQGRMADAARAFHPFVANDDELAALGADYYERSATAFPSLLQTSQASQTYHGPQATDPEAMAQISVPVLLLRGQQTRRATFYTDCEQYVAEHVTDPHLRELPDVGHFAPNLAPEPVAEALISFFGTDRQPA